MSFGKFGWCRTHRPDGGDRLSPPKKPREVDGQVDSAKNK